jgi:hypothetical protein
MKAFPNAQATVPSKTGAEPSGKFMPTGLYIGAAVSDSQS